MKKSVLAIIIAVVAIGAVTAIVVANNNGSDTGTQTPSPAPTGAGVSTDDKSNESSSSSAGSTNTNHNANAVEVEIEDFSYRPATVTVKKGTTVKWTNKDDVGHDVTPDQSSADFVASELLSKNESYSFTFNKAGSYAYHCSPHPQMKATVVVTE